MPRGITQDQVDQAADAIVALGERPTVEKIRQHLGTGSPNTVTRMLELWRQGLSERLRQASLLPELPDAVGQAMTALWAQALQHARTQAQQALQAEREALQRATTELDARASEQTTQRAAAEADRAQALEAAKLAAARAEVQNASQVITVCQKNRSALPFKLISDASQSDQRRQEIDHPFSGGQLAAFILRSDSPLRFSFMLL